MTTSVLLIATGENTSAAHQAELLAARLPNDQFEARTLLLGASVTRQIANTDGPGRVTTIDVASQWDVRGLLRLKQVLTHVQTDIVHALDEHASRLVALTAPLKPNYAVIITAESAATADWFTALLGRWARRRASRVVVSTQALRQNLEATGLAPGKIETVNPGVEPPHEMGAMVRKHLLDELHLPDETRFVGSAAPLIPRSRIKDMIWAADLLKCVRDDIHLLIIGDGPQRWRLERYRDQVEIADRVHLLGTRNDQAALLPLLDCYWSAGSFESTPMPMLMAMSAGVPVVAAATPLHAELIDGETTGLLVPLGDRAALARSTNRLLDDAALAERIGAAGRLRVVNEFSIDQMVRQCANLYAGALPLPR